MLGLILLMQIALTRLLEQVDPLTDEKTVAFAAQSGETRMVIACNVAKSQIFAYFEAGHIVYGSGYRAALAYRFDSDPMREPYNWPRNSRRVDVSDGDVAAFTKRLASAGTLKVRFYLPGERALDVHFGFNQPTNTSSPKLEALRSVAQACEGGKAGRQLTASIAAATLLAVPPR